MCRIKGYGFFVSSFLSSLCSMLLQSQDVCAPLSSEFATIHRSEAAIFGNYKPARRSSTSEQGCDLVLYTEEHCINLCSLSISFLHLILHSASRKKLVEPTPTCRAPVQSPQPGNVGTHQRQLQAALHRHHRRGGAWQAT